MAELFLNSVRLVGCIVTLIAGLVGMFIYQNRPAYRRLCCAAAAAAVLLNALWGQVLYTVLVTILKIAGIVFIVTVVFLILRSVWRYRRRRGY